MRGDRLRAAREALNMSQRDLESRCNFGERTISRWESGDVQPEVDRVARVADELRVSLDWLVGRSDTPHALYAQPSDLRGRYDEAISLAAAKGMSPDDLLKLLQLVSNIFPTAPPRKDESK